MAKMQRLWCEAGKHEWERPSKRGRKPLHCEECAKNPMLVAIAEATVTEEDRAARREAVKSPRNVVRLSEEERAKLTTRLAELEVEYGEAFKRANNRFLRDPHDIDKAFDRADRLQSAIISISGQLQRAEA